MEKCQKGCGLLLNAAHDISGPLSQQILACAPGQFQNSHALLDNSVFLGSFAEEKGGVVNCEGVSLSINNCTFEMTKDSTPPPSGGLVYYEGYRFFGTGVVFDATKVKSGSNVFTVKYTQRQGDTPQVDMVDVHVKCHPSYNGKEMHTPAVNVFDLLCQQTCSEGTYTLQGGGIYLSSLTVEPERKTYPSSSPAVYELESTPQKGQCLPCPAGALCVDRIHTLPHFWGYENSDHQVSVLRCPDGYCCTGNGTCAGLHSCNDRRSGTLCEECEHNFTESLFLPKCVSTEKCSTKLVFLLYTSLAAMYAGTLVGMSFFKKHLLDKGKNVIKRIRTSMKRKDKNNADIELEPNAPVEKSKDETEVEEERNSQVAVDPKGEEVKPENAGEEQGSGGMKYMQILFYYVQDASLFKVLLPEDQTDEESGLVKVLQFSPDVFGIYVRASELCLNIGTVAITKVLFSCCFGPCVICVLFLIYLIQRYVCLPVFKLVKFSSGLEGILVQAFLLVVLFSYQKIITGAFTLVHCVGMNNDAVLFIDGNISCYTWWQILITIYIVANIIPMLVVLSHAPFHVANKSMSVRMFVLTCIFPVPLMAFQLVRRILQKSNADDVSKELNYSEAENEIFHTLLRHYRTLSVCRVKFTWLGVHKFYRLVLVVANTYLTDPVIRLYTMSQTLLIITLASAFVKPYKDAKANKTATVSYVANISVATIAIGKAYLLKYGYQSTYVSRESLLTGLGMAEKVLLVWFPLCACILWVLHLVVEKLKSKLRMQRMKKNENRESNEKMT